MSEEQAIQIITQALNAANLKGVFNLSDSANIVNAINVITSVINELNSPKKQYSEPKLEEKNK